MGKEKHKRGKLLHKGETGNWWMDSKKGKKKAIAFAIVPIVGIWLFYIIYLMYGETIIVSELVSKILLAIGFAMFTIGIPGLVIALSGFEITAIYENGVTNQPTMLRYLKGESFICFEEITKIGYGVVPKDKRSYTRERSEFIALYTEEKDEPVIRVFYETQWENDFYQRLKEVLKEKCSQVEQVKVDWDSLPKRKK